MRGFENGDSPDRCASPFSYCRVAGLRPVLAAMAVVLWFPALSLSAPGPAAWVDDMRNALGEYMWTHPAAPLAPYLETLTLVREAVGRGDRRAVKREMEAYFSMLAMRAQGISESEAKELAAAALRATPAQAYGISIPRELRR
jgi:hypothetical protein